MCFSGLGMIFLSTRQDRVSLFFFESLHATPIFRGCRDCGLNDPMLVCSPERAGDAGRVPTGSRGDAPWPQKEGVMGRKTGAYKFEKRRKELKRQKKREEKLARKLSKDSDDPDDMTDTVDSGDTVDTVDTDDTDDTEEKTNEPQ